MKKNLLLVFTVFSLTASAQTSVYHPFADSGAVWVMRWTNSCTMVPCVLNCTADYQYRVDGDTIISGNTYKKVIKEGYSVNNCNCVMNVASCSGSTYGSSFYMGIRDDVPNRKSYINDGVNPEELFFNFNLNVGDTIQNRFCTTNIIYLDSVLIGNTYRKSYMVTGNATVIEGIGYWDGGYYSGPFEGCGACVCNDMWELQCYRLNGVTLLGDTSCALVTTVPQVADENFAITVSPNPAVSELTIQNAKAEIESIEVCDTMGQLQTLNYRPQTFSADVSSLSAGMYFLRLKTPAGIKTLKFLKSR